MYIQKVLSMFIVVCLKSTNFIFSPMLTVLQIIIDLKLFKPRKMQCSLRSFKDKLKNIEKYREWCFFMVKKFFDCNQIFHKMFK